MDNRLETEKNIWLATVRVDGRPHLVPIWFTWVNQLIYICTEAKSVKVRNITENPSVSFSLQDGDKPIIGEGRAQVLVAPYPVHLISAFYNKYNWDIGDEIRDHVLIEITPMKWLSW